MSSTLVQHCKHVIQMFCVYWESYTAVTAHFTSKQLLLFIFAICKIVAICKKRFPATSYLKWRVT